MLKQLSVFIKILSFGAGLLLLTQCVFGQGKDSSANSDLQADLEHQLFPGAKLTSGFSHSFSGKFIEMTIKTQDGYKLSGILFKAKQSKGLVFYLHGSNNALDTWGKISTVYLNHKYDIFLLDYRGYGKSESKVSSEKQLYSDVQTAYDTLKQIYPESKIILIGHSIGTGPAAMLAANNNPKALILQAPYYSIPDWIHHIAPELDTSNFKYQLNTYRFLQLIKAPVTVFHGDADEAIYLDSSKKLSLLFKEGDKLIVLKGEGHNNFIKNKQYLENLNILLK